MSLWIHEISSCLTSQIRTHVRNPTVKPAWQQPRVPRGPDRAGMVVRSSLGEIMLK